MVEWTLLRDGTAEDGLYDVQLTDTANPFGDFAIAKIDDAGGAKFDQYSRGTRVELEVTPTDSTTPISRFTGFVVERRELNQNGADSLEIEAYSFDQFLRNNTVSNDLSGLSLTDALKNIVQNDTPVAYVAGNVDVGDPQTIRRSFRGEKVETALQALAFKSQNEAFGVNDALEFFFRPRETEHISRGIDDTEWFTYDIPELAKEARNEVEVWYNDGQESVVVDDGQDKLDLQDSLNLSDAGIQRAEIQRPNITQLSDAEDEGRQFLQLRNATLTGEVTTFGLFEAAPGDTIDITISERGIDSEFTIAAVEYDWGRDETTLTIVEKKGNDNAEVIVRLTESVQRIEMEGANRDGAQTRITTTEATAQLTPSVSGDSTSASDARVTNDLRNIIRDAWTGEGLPTVDTIAVGSDGSDLSRSNTALNNQTASASVSESLPNATSVEYTASLSQTGVEEIGLLDASGTLLVRGVFDAPIDITTDATVSVAVSDNSGERSVVTADGQTAIRDIIADNSPTLPNEYAYGAGSSTPTVSDTTLDNPEVRQQLDDVRIDEYALQSDFEEFIAPIPDDVPLGFTQTGELTQLQTTQFQEAEDNPGDGTVVSSNLPGDYSSFDAVELDTQGDSTSFSFTFDYRVPSGEASADIYAGFDNFDGTYEVTVDGDVAQSQTFSSTTANNQFLGSGFIDKEFTAGQKISVGVEVTTLNSGRMLLDTAQVHDNLNRFSNITSDRNGTVDTSTASNILTAPDLYPEVQSFDVPVVKTTRDVTEARIDSEFNDVSENQFLELSNDGTNYQRADNTETFTATFGSASREIYSRFGIGHYEQNTTTSPRFDASQTIDLFQLFADVDAVVTDDIGAAFTRAVIDGGDVVGSTIQEAGVFDSSTATCLTRHVFAPFDVTSSDTTIVSAETTRLAQE